MRDIKTWAFDGPVQLVTEFIYWRYSKDNTIAGWPTDIFSRNVSHHKSQENFSEYQKPMRKSIRAIPCEIMKGRNGKICRPSSTYFIFSQTIPTYFYLSFHSIPSQDLKWNSPNFFCCIKFPSTTVSKGQNLTTVNVSQIKWKIIRLMFYAYNNTPGDDHLGRFWLFKWPCPFLNELFGRPVWTRMLPNGMSLNVYD